MILAIHQPEFLPYLGFFQKVARAEHFVFLDHVQFSKGDIQNRNYIRNKEGKILLTVPVEKKGHLDKAMKDIKIVKDHPWQKKHLKTIYYAYKDAPYFDYFYPEIQKIYKNSWENLVDLNVAFIKLFFNILDIKVSINFSSEFNITSKKTEMIIDICKAVRADTYISGMGAKDYLDVKLLNSNGIKNYFCKFVHPEYPQINEPFIPNLSVIDLIFNCGENSKYYLDLAIKNSPLEE